MNHNEFWESGYRVFPLCGKHDQEGNELPEKEQYKKPRNSGYQYTPVWSDEQFDLMTTMGQFDTGFGVLCSGLLVVDIDARNRGVESYARLVEQIPEISSAGLIVNTGSGGGSKHLYFKVPSDLSLKQHHDDFKGIDFKTSGFVVGPGSMHVSGNKYEIAYGSIDDIDHPPQALIDLLKRPEFIRTEYNGGTMDVSHAEIANMLSYIDNSDMHYEDWLRIGMSIHFALSGDGYELWDDWSQKSQKYDPKSMPMKWHSFGKSANPVTIGTLIHYAEQGGWRQPVTFDFNGEFEDDDEPINPLDTTGVDLLRPPGFAGELCKWINDQCRYPREHLAVAATLVCLGNVVGLRYTDDLDGVTANLFGFGVAGSASGKEAVLQAANDVMHYAGLSAAVYGPQKSSQEVTRNLITHQASFYVIDEFGLELKKIVNAQKKGGASYLETLPASLMSYYSKANGFAPLSGDVKKEIRQQIHREISQHEDAIANNEDPTGSRQESLESAQKILSNIDRGLDRPFLSMIGFTTPETFDELMTQDQATSGFVGRAILVRENETNPRDKRPFKKRPMSDAMSLTLSQLYTGVGEFSVMDRRVEYYGERTPIQTNKNAVEALRTCLDWFLDYSEDQKEASGLEAIPRRGYELVSKVSLILAAPHGVRTIEHVRWAFALVKRDIDTKIRLVMSNDETHSAIKRIMVDISKYVSTDHGETTGVVSNRLRHKYSKDDVAKALLLMEEKGILKKEQTTHPKNKRVIDRWYLVAGKE